MLHQTLGRGEDGSDLIGWAGRPKVTLEVDRDARTRTSGATRENSDGPCRQRETERLHRGGHLIPITPEGSLRVPFTSTLIDQCPSEGSRDDARCRPLSKRRHHGCSAMARVSSSEARGWPAKVGLGGERAENLSYLALASLPRWCKALSQLLALRMKTWFGCAGEGVMTAEATSIVLPDAGESGDFRSTESFRSERRSRRLACPRVEVVWEVVLSG